MLLICQFIVYITNGQTRHGTISISQNNLHSPSESNQQSEIIHLGKVLYVSGYLMHITISKCIIFFSDLYNHYMRYVYLCLSALCFHIVYCFLILFSMLFLSPVFIQSSRFGSRMCNFFMSFCSSGFTDRFLWDTCESGLGTALSYRKKHKPSDLPVVTHRQEQRAGHQAAQACSRLALTAWLCLLEWALRCGNFMLGLRSPRVMR